MANHTKGRKPPNKTIAPATDKVFQEKVAKERKKKEARKAKDKKSASKTKVDTTPIISIDKYNEMYTAYMDRQTVNHVAKTCNVHVTTAKRYIEKGDPKRNLRPLQDRYKAVMQQTQIKEDYDLAKNRAETLLAARAMLKKISARILTADMDEVSPDALPRLLKDIQQVAERALGAADQTVDFRDKTDRYDSWTEQELLAFFQTGVTPEHDRSVAPISTAQKSSKE